MTIPPEFSGRGRGSMCFCPYCAHELEHRSVDGRTRAVCPSCKTVLYRDPKLAAAVVVEDNAGRILLVRRGVGPRLGDWCLPSGFVEYDEGPDEAAVRECHEETGLEIELTGLLDVHSFDDPFRNKKGALIVYAGCPTGGDLAPGDDASEAAFFSPAQVPANIAFDGHANIIRVWQGQM